MGLMRAGKNHTKISEQRKYRVEGFIWMPQDFKVDTLDSETWQVEDRERVTKAFERYRLISVAWYFGIREGLAS